MGVTKAIVIFIGVLIVVFLAFDVASGFSAEGRFERTFTIFVVAALILVALIFITNRPD